MTKPDFTDAEVKLERAREHIEDVKSRIAAFLATDFYVLRLKENSEKGRVEIIFDSLHQPNKSLNAIIGDAAGTLRSVLDYVVVALTFSKVGRSDKNGFPFADDEAGFKGEVKSERCLGSCDSTVQNTFLSVEAYKNGSGHDFWVLNKLRNIDKHRLLITATQIATMTASFRDRNNNVFIDSTIGIEAGNSQVYIDAPIGHITFTSNPKYSFTVLLDEAEIIKQDVVNFLESTFEKTKNLLNIFKEIG